MNNDISTEVRAHDPASTPILSLRPWREVKRRAFECGAGSNVTQINSTTFQTGDEASRQAAISKIKAEIEQTILSGQEMDAGSIEDRRPRRTASMRALGADASEIEIAFLRPFAEQELPGGETMIVVEWGLHYDMSACT